jgi:hypothetical protein
MDLDPSSQPWSRGSHGPRSPLQLRRDWESVKVDVMRRAPSQVRTARAAQVSSCHQRERSSAARCYWGDGGDGSGEHAGRYSCSCGASLTDGFLHGGSSKVAAERLDQDGWHSRLSRAAGQDCLRKGFATRRRRAGSYERKCQNTAIVPRLQSSHRSRRSRPPAGIVPPRGCRGCVCAAAHPRRVHYGPVKVWRSTRKRAAEIVVWIRTRHIRSTHLSRVSAIAVVNAKVVSGRHEAHTRGASHRRSCRPPPKPNRQAGYLARFMAPWRWLRRSRQRSDSVRSACSVRVLAAPSTDSAGSNAPVLTTLFDWAPQARHPNSRALIGESRSRYAHPHRAAGVIGARRQAGCDAAG